MTDKPNGPAEGVSPTDEERLAVARAALPDYFSLYDEADHMKVLEVLYSTKTFLASARQVIVPLLDATVESGRRLRAAEQRAELLESVLSNAQDNLVDQRNATADAIARADAAEAELAEVREEVARLKQRERPSFGPGFDDGNL